MSLKLVLVLAVLNTTSLNGHLPGPAYGSFNWAGYSVFARDNKTYFKAVEGAWTVPVIPTPSLTQKVLSIWVGLGTADPQDTRSQTLWQAGTQRVGDYPEFGYWDQDNIAPPVILTGQYSFWFEDYGCNNPCPNLGKPVFVSQPVLHGGDRVYVKISSQDGTVSFTNLTTGESKTYQVSIDNNHTGSSAEWVAEESGDCDANSPRCQYVPPKGITFTDMYVYSSRLSSYIDFFNYRRFDLTDNQGLLLTRPSPITQHSFTTK